MIDCLLDSTEVIGLPLFHSGKVRDVYTIPGYNDWLLFVTTDRISAYDVVMDKGVPNKGRVLTQLSLFWFDMMSDIIPNHVVTANVSEYPDVCQPYAKHLVGRSMIVRKLKPLPIECIVRGRWTGSYWEAYQKALIKHTESEFVSVKEVCGFQFQTGLQENEEIKPSLFTPSTKAELGLHDENITLEETEKIIGKSRLAEIETVSIKLYQRAAAYALERGIIIADTKFELGLDADNNLIWIDEALTPDSSRFWPVNKVVLGKTPPSLDKQPLRDWLLTLDWNKEPPAPPIPIQVIADTADRYLDALKCLMGY